MTGNQIEQYLPGRQDLDYLECLHCSSHRAGSTVIKFCYSRTHTMCQIVLTLENLEEQISRSQNLSNLDRTESHNSSFLEQIRTISLLFIRLHS